MPHRESAGLPSWIRSSFIGGAGAFLGLVAVVLTAGFLWREQRTLENEELQSVEMYARVLQESADRTFDTIDLTLASLTAQAAARGTGGTPGDYEVVSASMAQTIAGLPFLRSLSLVDRSRRVVASTERANVGVQLDPARVPLPEEQQADVLGRIVAGRDLVNAAPGGPASPLGRMFIPLVRAAGTLYVVAVLNPEFFANQQDLTLADRRRDAALFSADAVLLSATGGVRLAPGQAAPSHAFFTRYFPRRESGSFIGAGIDGDQVATAFRVLRKRPVLVVVESAYERVAVPFQRSVLWAAGTCGTALLFIAAMTVMAFRSLRGYESTRAALRATRRSVAESERNLEAQLAFTAQLLEVSPVPLFVKDREGRFENVNRAWLELMGLRPGEVLGRTSSDLYGVDGSKHHAQDVRLMRTGQHVRYENRLAIPGREPKDTIVEKVRFTGADGMPAGIVGSIIDVTEFRNAEREIREARDAAQRANDAKSAFLANITHELRTPLQGIIGFSEIGAQIAAGSPEFLEMFDDIQLGGQRMLTLVNGLLDVAQMEDALGSMTLEPRDLGEMVREAAEIAVTKAAAKGQSIVVDWPARPLFARVDAVRLQQAIAIVLANAIDYGPRAATIRVEGGTDEAGGIVVAVRDTGPGIPEGELERIFEAFVQSSRTSDGSGGTGLGLTIARKIMGAHGGSIVAANGAQGGAVVRLRLPRIEPVDGESVHAAGALETEAPGSSGVRS